MRLYEADSMTHCATQKTTEVCFDTRARKSASWPDDIRTRLAAVVAVPS
jgi:acyl-CoA thioesterase FadM